MSRRVVDGLGSLAKAELFRIVDDAHNDSGEHPPIQRRMSGPEPPGHRFIDDHRMRTALRYVRVGKGTAFRKTNSQDLEIVRQDGAALDRRWRGSRLCAFGHNVSIYTNIVVIRKWRSLSRSDGLRARQRAQPRQQIPVKRFDVFRIRVTRRRKLEFER